MEKRAWTWLVFWGFALVFFVMTLVVIRWTIDFVTWSTLDSGWAQVLGAIAALGVAIFVMSRQNAHSARLTAQTERRALIRRAEMVYQIMVRCDLQICAGVKSVREHVEEGNQEKIRFIAEIIKEALIEARFSLTQIPVYDMGNTNLVVGIHQMMGALSILDYVVRKAGTGHVRETGDKSILDDIERRAKIGIEKFLQGQTELANAH